MAPRPPPPGRRGGRARPPRPGPGGRRRRPGRPTRRRPPGPRPAGARPSRPGHRSAVGGDRAAGTAGRRAARTVPCARAVSIRRPAAEAPSGPVTKRWSPGAAPERSSRGAPSSGTGPTTVTDTTSTAPEDRSPPTTRQPAAGGVGHPVAQAPDREAPRGGHREQGVGQRAAHGGQVGGPATMSAFQPTSSGEHTAGSTWTPSTTRSMASAARPAPGRVATAASSPMPVACGEAVPAGLEPDPQGLDEVRIRRARGDRLPVRARAPWAQRPWWDAGSWPNGSAPRPAYHGSRGRAH